MYSAVAESDLRFRLVHEPDLGPIGYEKVCKLEETVVPDEEIEKAYEFDDGTLVVVRDEDFEAAEREGYRTIDIADFVPYEEIDPIYFERTYYLGPGEGGEKVYRLLAEAMERSSLAAIATYVMRDREHLGAMRVRDGVITLAKMYFADEIRPTDGIAPRAAKVAERELEMALELVDRFKGAFEPEKYRDTYRERLLERIEELREGRRPAPPPRRREVEAPDLLDALRASLEEAKRAGGRGATRRKAERPRRRKTAPRR